MTTTATSTKPSTVDAAAQALIGAAAANCACPRSAPKPLPAAERHVMTVERSPAPRVGPGTGVVRRATRTARRSIAPSGADAVRVRWACTANG